uniref:DBF4-type zinc finger-containing protein 2 isoform X4 n=1 Tax=Gasterosteus aculeatus aculeatus TaxID=481459 RepID=UPI001A982707|nr:DBF4-type zinc finger-containing protein 2 isoform X4 [Gasterosteus aculeatus aculeatus]
MSERDEGDQKENSTSRMCGECQPGPSGCEPSRQGYCGYCRVLYNNLHQHLSSLRHLDSVRASPRGSSTVSSSISSTSKLTLLERFLQDVLQHHPHRYNDPRPSHADLPPVCTPFFPRTELNELGFCDDDRRSLGTCEHLSSSDNAANQPVNQKEDNRTQSQLFTGFGSQQALSGPIREQEDRDILTAGNIMSSQVHTPPPHHQAPSPVHRKAHRKTNRRKTTGTTSVPRPDTGRGVNPGSRSSFPWQREGREAFSLGRTTEEEKSESFEFSLPVSMETQSEDWDTPVQREPIRDAPIQVSTARGHDLSGLMDVEVALEDQVYSCQLDSALHSERRSSGRAQMDLGFWTLPIEEVLPAPEHIPESFKGKTWTQIEQEDEGRVDKLVRQFRRGQFICYFDTESLAMYGRRGENKEEEPTNSILPLLDCNDNASPYVRRRKGRAFRVASRCQVVKISHSTQTIRFVVPTLPEPASETLAPSVPTAHQEAAERTPEGQTWRCLPPSYLGIVTPLQPRTSLVYLICSPSGSTPSYNPAIGYALKRCRKKRRPLDAQGLKVKYKQFPIRLYDPTSNRILKNHPKGFVPYTSPPRCVRHLFRSLSLDLNADRPLGWGGIGSFRIKGQRSLNKPLGQGKGTKDTVGRRGRTAQNPPTFPHSRGGRRDRRRPSSIKKRTRDKAPAHTAQERRPTPSRTRQ